MNYNAQALLCKGIYGIVRTSTQRVYIGKTRTSFCRRWAGHLNELQSGKHTCRDLQCDWNELGADVFDFVILSAFIEIPSWLYQSLDCLEHHMVATASQPLYNSALLSVSPGDVDIASWLFSPPAWAGSTARPAVPFSLSRLSVRS